MAREVEWNEEFDIGVEILDNAHKKLFSIVRRILQLTNQEKKNQWACVEGIKYFKSYTIQHFQEEEEYLRSINYPGYAVHKQLHDNLREKTIPALEENLEKSDYSKEAVEQFLGVCIGWLTGHIMVEDKAITGKAKSRWLREQPESERQALEESLVLATKEVFCQEACVFSDHYGGEDIGKIMTYYFIYKAPDGRHVRILIALENDLALSAVEMMLNASLKKAHQAVSTSLGFMLRQFLRSIAVCFNVSRETYELAETPIINLSLHKFFRDEYPKYSILLDTNIGRLAFCVKLD